MTTDVAFFDPYPHNFGGAQVVTLNLAKELVQRGVAVRLMSTAAGEATRRAADLGLRVEVLEMPEALSVFGHRTSGLAAGWAAAALPLAWARIARAMRPLPAVLHAIDLRGVLLAGPPSRVLGVPVVWHLHSTEPQPSLNKIGAALSAAAIVPSNAALAELPHSVRRKAAVIPGGIDHGVAVAQARFEEPLVVCAARLTEEKGIDVLVEAAASLRCRVPRSRVRVFGSAQRGRESYAVDMEQRIADLSMEDSFELCGFVDTPASHWTSASVYVQPSRKEPLGLAALEAMTIGLPVVGSAVGGLREIVEHGKTGLLVPPEDPDALARALGELLSDPQRARRMGEAARQRVAGRFTIEAMADAVQSLYAEVA